jgi:hypothetical protein
LREAAHPDRTVVPVIVVPVLADPVHEKAAITQAVLLDPKMEVLLRCRGKGNGA